MKKLMIIALTSATLQVSAQQWLGPANSTGQIYRSGDVGIGTTVPPIQKLQVANGNIMLDDGSTAGLGNLYFAGNTAASQNGMRLFFLSTPTIVAGGFVDVRTANPTEGLKFRVDNINGGTERMRVCANGNVGIGTANPSQRFHLHNGAIKITGTVPGYGGPMVLFGSANTDGSGIEQWGIEYIAAAPNPGLNFWKPFGSPNAGNYYMFLADNGNIGIRNNTPAYSLDVTGTGRFTTSLQVFGGALVSAKLTASSNSAQYPLATWCSNSSGGGAYLEGINTGVYGLAGFHTGTGTPFEAIGVWGMGGPLGTNKGVGVHGDGQGNLYSVGVWGQANGGAFNYGVWGDVPSFAGYAGYFSGDVYCTGSYLPSDKNLKKNIVEIDNAMEIIGRMKSYTYEYKTDQYPHMNLPASKQYGFLSQEVETIMPELIKVTVQPDELDKEGNIVNPSVEFKAINYTALIPLLVEGLKEQQAEINDLKNRIAQMEQQGSNGSVGSINIARMEQNIPNPSDGSTTIRYYLPESVKTASISIFDMNGSAIRTLPIQQPGNGSFTIQAGELSAGTYTYTLTSDGVIVSSYKMIITR